MSATKKAYENIILLLFLLIAVSFVLAILNVPKWFFDLVTSLFVSAISGAIISFLMTALVEALTGDLLKGIMITVKIKGFDFSISLFVLSTIILRLVLFH